MRIFANYVVVGIKFAVGRFAGFANRLVFAGRLTAKMSSFVFTVRAFANGTSIPVMRFIVFHRGIIVLGGSKFTTRTARHIASVVVFVRVRFVIIARS